MEVSKKGLIILGIVAAVILAILAFIGVMVGVSLKSLTTQERECFSKTRSMDKYSTRARMSMTRPQVNFSTSYLTNDLRP